MGATAPSGDPHDRHAELFAGLHRAAGELFSCKKTDIAAGPGVALSTSRLVVPGRVRALVGWSLAETTAAAGANVRLRDGSGTANEVLARINLGANESDRENFLPYGIEVATGNIFLEVLSGSVEGVIYWL